MLRFISLGVHSTSYITNSRVNLRVSLRVFRKGSYSGPGFKVGAGMGLVGVVLGGHPYQEPGFLEKVHPPDRYVCVCE